MKMRAEWEMILLVITTVPTVLKLCWMEARKPGKVRQFITVHEVHLMWYQSNIIFYIVIASIDLLHHSSFILIN